jgi:hypothetical protein
MLPPNRGGGKSTEFVNLAGNMLIPLLFALLALPFPAPVDQLPQANVTVERERHEIVIELPAIDLPAADGPDGMTMVEPPVCQAVLPISGWLVAYRVQVLDAAGRRLPQAMLHHFNLTDPARRDLFAPLPLHMLAASKETPSVSVPWFVIGMPVVAGQRMLASGMAANHEPHPVSGVRLRLILSYVPGNRPWPLFAAYPWSMDVMFPLGQPKGGSKGFDLPPGRTEKSWESSPAIAGRIVGLSGHVHDYARFLELKDMTTGNVIWHAEPTRDSSGIVSAMPVARFYRWYRIGVRIHPSHRYRVTVVYDNPTGRVLPLGGMGAVAGLFVPAGGARWPQVDPADTVYQRGLSIELHKSGSSMADMMMMERHRH